VITNDRHTYIKTLYPLTVISKASVIYRIFLSLLSVLLYNLKHPKSIQFNEFIVHKTYIHVYSKLTKQNIVRKHN